MTRQEYAEYLKSDHWKELRGEKRRRSKKTGGRMRCAICASTDRIETHHLQYKGVYDVETTDLRMLCHDCHTVAHELMASGELKITSTSHHGMFSQLKRSVKKARGFGNRNMFKERL